MNQKEDVNKKLYTKRRIDVIEKFTQVSIIDRMDVSDLCNK